MPGTFNPRKFLEIGKSLLNDGRYDEDSKVRTAMGRIYYAAFLVAWKKLEHEGIAIRDRSKVHEEVIDAYMDRGFTNIGGKLDQLRERRVDADYHMMVDLALNECRQLALLSERTIQLIEQIRTIAGR
jgi:uncharacterized protein (UPF0332 family)